MHECECSSRPKRACLQGFGFATSYLHSASFDGGSEAAVVHSARVSAILIK
jgi:hypothetical protein